MYLQVDPGAFTRASEDVLKARRIVKTRRPASVVPSVAASANPFSGVSLGVPSVQSASASNPVNSVSDSVPRKASEEAEQVGMWPCSMSSTVLSMCWTPPLNFTKTHIGAQNIPTNSQVYTILTFCLLRAIIVRYFAIVSISFGIKEKPRNAD